MENTAKNQKQKIATILILIIAIAVVGYYMYRDMKNKSAATASNTASSAEVDATNNYTTKQIPLDEPPGKMPDLTRPIVLSDNLPEEVKSRLLSKINELIEQLKKNPNSLENWLDLGIYRKQNGDYEGAKEVWEYAVFLNPLYYVSFSNLGDLYTHYIKDYPKAEENLKKAISLKTDYIDGYRSLYELYRYSYKEKESLADDTLLQGLTKNPKSTDLMVLLAQYYKEIGEKSQALTYYNKALAEAQAQGNTALADLLKQEIQTL